jgi:hypothetical protein
MPYYKEHLLSSWPSHLVYEVGAPPAKIDSQILNSMTRTDIGFFAKNPRTKRRYQTEHTRQNDRVGDSLSAPKFLSEKARAAQSAFETETKATENIEALTDLHLDEVTRKDVPAMYGNVEIKYSKFGVDDFDFAYVNSLHKLALTHVGPDTTIKHNIQGSKRTLRIRMRIPCYNFAALLPVFATSPSYTRPHSVLQKHVCYVSSGFWSTCSKKPPG